MKNQRLKCREFLKSTLQHSDARNAPCCGNGVSVRFCVTDNIQIIVEKCRSWPRRHAIDTFVGIGTPVNVGTRRDILVVVQTKRFVRDVVKLCSLSNHDAISFQRTLRRQIAKDLVFSCGQCVVRRVQFNHRNGHGLSLGWFKCGV